MGASAIKHITVALDGSPASEAAVHYACEIAIAGATLLFCSVGGEAQAAVGQARALGITADHHESKLHLAEAVAACAHQHASEAIVFGSDGRHEFVHVRDSVGESLMRIADRPVIFVHEADRYQGGDVAVAISGYDKSHLVIDAAIAIALALDRELFLVTEVTVPHNVHYYAPDSYTDARLVQAAERALAAGVKSATKVGDGVGSIPSSLIEMAKGHGCSMIVTGLHDHSGMARFFNGGVAHAIMLEAHVPVAVVHHAKP